MDQHIHHGSCGCAEEAKGPLELYCLFESMKQDSITALNEKVPGSVRGAIKPFEERLRDDTPVIKSECDGEVLLKVEFESEVKVRAIGVRCKDKVTAPKELKVWFNREDIDFSNCHNTPAAQVIALPFDPALTFRNGIRPTVGGNVHSATILLNKPYGGGELEISHVAILGHDQGHKRGVVQCRVELNPNLADHKIDKITESSTFLSK